MKYLLILLMGLGGCVSHRNITCYGELTVTHSTKWESSISSYPCKKVCADEVGVMLLLDSESDRCK